MTIQDTIIYRAVSLYSYTEISQFYANKGRVGATDKVIHTLPYYKLYYTVLYKI